MANLTLQAGYATSFPRYAGPFDPKLTPNQQDKRSVVPIEPEDVDTCFTAPLSQAAQIVQLAEVDVFAAGAAAGLATEESLVQSNVVYHSGADGFSRLACFQPCD